MKTKTKKKFTIYQDGGAEVFIGPNETALNRFIFMGFSDGIHPYFRNQMQWAKGMLLSKGIVLNSATYRHVDQIGEAPGGWWEDPELINLPDRLEVSKDGYTYFHAQDSEMGRGGAILMEIDPDGNKKILMSDHRDNVREEICWDWVKKKGVDLEVVNVEDEEGGVEKYLKK